MPEQKYIIVGGELYHYGVKGMKWGVVKDDPPSGEAAYREKLKKAAVTATNNRHNSTAARLEYRNQNLGTRVGTTALGIAGSMAAAKVTSTLMRGERFTMTGKDWLKAGLKLVGGTTLSVLYKDALADSAAKRYDNKGREIEKEGAISKEDKIDVGVKVAAAAGLAVYGTARRRAETRRSATRATSRRT